LDPQSLDSFSLARSAHSDSKELLARRMPFFFNGKVITVDLISVFSKLSPFEMKNSWLSAPMQRFAPKRGKIRA
jgi:hypothetical protein